MGYLPELPPLYMDMTVREYLNFVAELKKLDKKERKQLIDEAMETTKISELETRLVRNLSKGYRQRVGFAQAILGYPEIIILDEPTVGLDPKQIIEIRELIRELGKKHTVILSSHILTEVSAVCDYIFILSKGKLVASDTTENLLNEMSGAQEISLLVEGERERAMSAIGEIADVEKIKAVETTEEAAVQMAVLAKKGCDIRKELFHACVDNGLCILEMSQMTRSLEDIFLELTESTKSGQEEA